MSEKIAELIAKELKLKCARIEIGTYCGDKGCLSYNMVNDTQTMTEGVSYISRKYNTYDNIEGKDIESGKYYCLEMILNSLDTDELRNHFLKIMIFDFIIGNSDRHCNNWAIMKNRSNKESFAPVYDNGSSLCALVKDSEISSFIDNSDKMKFNSLVDTKSRTLIRINGKDKKIPTHREVLNYLHDNYYNETKDFAKTAIQKLTEEKICNILRQVNGYITNDRFLLLKKYLLAKINILKNIYGRGD